jgi:hypothetical protein
VASLPSRIEEQTPLKKYETKRGNGRLNSDT